MITRTQREEKHRIDFKTETNLIVNSKIGCNIINHGQTILFREPGMPRVDFSPSSGKWKTVDGYFEGGAQAFLDWYDKQRLKSA